MRALLARLAAWGGPNVDKMAHMLAGLVVGLLAAWLTGDGLTAMLAAWVAGLTKAVYDDCRPATHTADPWDFVATVAGGVIVWGLW